MTDYPDVTRILAERQELIRRCAVRVLEDHNTGRCVDPETLKWAACFVQTVPALAGPMSDGTMTEMK